MTTAESIRNLFPTYEDIHNDYKGVTEFFKGVKTKEQVLKILGKHWCDPYAVEINGDPAPLYDDGNDNIEWIRCQTWGCLDYIYFFFNDGKVNQIIFDVWDTDDVDDCLMHDVKIEDVTREYYEECLNRKIKELE